MKASFNKLLGGVFKDKEAPFWLPANQVYPCLMDIDPEPLGLRGRPGLYAVWHLGVRPQWLRVGAVKDLAETVTALKLATWAVVHRANGGPFLAWALPDPDKAVGHARHLADTLKPAFQTELFPFDIVDPAAQSLTCILPPGTRI